MLYPSHSLQIARLKVSELFRAGLQVPKRIRVLDLLLHQAVRQISLCELGL